MSSRAVCGCGLVHSRNNTTNGIKLVSVASFRPVRLLHPGFTFCRFPLLSSSCNLMTSCRIPSMPFSTPLEGGASFLATSITSEKKLTTSICVCVPRSGRSLQNVARNCVAGLKRLPRKEGMPHVPILFAREIPAQHLALSAETDSQNAQTDATYPLMHMRLI